MAMPVCAQPDGLSLAAVCLAAAVINCRAMSAANFTLEPLDRESILRALPASGIDCGLQIFEQLDSTNRWLLAQCGESASLPLACIAEAQSAGRGRHGRVWHSPAGSSLYLSLGWRFAGDHEALAGFSLLMGVATVRALRQLGLTQAGLKWPNDVLVAGKKIAGILIESRPRNDGSLAVVTGIGVNIALPASERAHIDQACTDVCEQLSAPCSRNQLAALLLGECLAVCAGFPDNRAALLDEYRREYDTLLHQAVTIQRGDAQPQAAQALAIEDSGALRVCIDGVEQSLMAGEVSLRSAG